MTEQYKDEVVLDFPLETEMVNLLTRISFEKDGRYSLIKQFCSDTTFKPDGDKVDELIMDYLVLNTKMNLIFNEIVKKNINTVKPYLDKGYRITSQTAVFADSSMYMTLAI